MKNLNKTEFDLLYEELSNLNEGKGDKSYSELNFDTIRDEVEKNPGLWFSIAIISDKLKKRFGTNYTWQYQFQLMYNAYQTEKKAKELLNNSTKLRDDINNALKKVGVNRVLAKEYQFNEWPNVHEVFSAKIANREVGNDDGAWDISAVTPAENEIASVEVKASVGDKVPSNFHNAELVFIFYLDIAPYLVIKYRGNDGKYYDLPGIYYAVKSLATDDCIRVYERAEIRPFNEVEQGSLFDIL